MKASKKSSRFYIRIYCFTVAALLIPAGFLISQTRKLNTAEMLLSANYSNALHESIANLEVISNSFHNGSYSDGGIEHAAEIWRAAGAAKACFDILPPTASDFDKLYSYLSQVGDYAYISALSQLDGGEGADAQTVAALMSYNDTLLQKLNDLALRYDGNKLPIGTLESAADEISIQGQISGLITDDMTYPLLNYDGKTSEHLKNVKYALLEGAKNITGEEGLQKAAEFLGVDLGAVTRRGNSDGDMKCYEFESGEKSLYVTAAGGYPCTYINGRELGAATFSAEDAIAKAGEGLKTLGYDGLVPHSYTDMEKVVYCDFVYSENGVLVLPDKVTVCVAKDNGEIIAMTATGYIENHVEGRLNLTAAMSAEDAGKSFKDGITPNEGRLVIRDSDGGIEQLCYEFICEREGESALCYVDANTGKLKKTESFVNKTIL